MNLQIMFINVHNQSIVIGVLHSIKAEQVEQIEHIEELEMIEFVVAFLFVTIRLHCTSLLLLVLYVVTMQHTVLLMMRQSSHVLNIINS